MKKVKEVNLVTSRLKFYLIYFVNKFNFIVHNNVKTKGVERVLAQ